ncbi:thioredoxin domain-containing protein [Aliivibrio sifiae]|uniref:Thiol-disulfide isomerase n=1 Tax=Aliivibrio sifiae TaxID=566293 RepID=A0A2S7X3C4_9GAMM|nr:thioredoxin domain-containing protein [Aliivibrio sifiae]PQJ84683.1 thiol-disulfide isomerase [Aliivibrio sifiae]
MKFIKPFLLILSISLFFSAYSYSGEPKEGVQYETLSSPLKSEVLSPVTEVFSLSCHPCRNMENFLPAINQELDTNIDKMHIIFNQSTYMTAMLYYAAEIQTKGTPDHSFINDLFSATQDYRSAKEQQHAYEQAFISRDLTSPTKLSREQINILTNKVKNAKAVSEKSRINAVPTFIVNGKYTIILGGHANPKEIADTIRYLLNK